MLSCAFTLRNPSAFLCHDMLYAQISPSFLYHERVSHSGILGLLARDRKLHKAMNLLMESEFMFFRVVFAP